MSRSTFMLAAALILHALACFAHQSARGARAGTSDGSLATYPADLRAASWAQESGTSTSSVELIAANPERHHVFVAAISDISDAAESYLRHFDTRTRTSARQFQPAAARAL
jgi:hypothetical protein